MYDNPYWEHHLPINPAGAYFKEGFDVMMTELDIANWEGEGGPEFSPRLRDEVQRVSRDMVVSAAGDDEAPELDMEYDCD